ncbi:hypothetical protein BV898_05521 [Hypsibius exemplaris]|uniref:WW domain-containing protein n=1 Tax=Hypsibius exemplaris TaxID=2072580 RepID=A0A1W0WZ38_HYPEX|nr:hypothetical protein BV898_05521 [Hypsibius exemplaris]
MEQRALGFLGYPTEFPGYLSGFLGSPTGFPGYPTGFLGYPTGIPGYLSGFLGYLTGFLGHATQTTQWIPPTENWDAGEWRLPYGWECAADIQGRIYYIK